MAGNFQFTGAPKPAMYNPKGLDFFLAAPALRAELQGAAMTANQLARVDSTGLDVKDIPIAQAMTSTLEQSRSKMTDFLLSDAPVTKGTVKTLVNNINQKKEVSEKLTYAKENAKRLQEYEKMLDMAALNTGRFEYYGKVKDKTKEQWQGSFTPDGQFVPFTPVTPPTYVDVKKDLKDRLAVVMGNMEKESPGSTKDLNIQLLKKDVEGGTQYILTYNKAKDKESNLGALDAFLDDFNNQLANPNTEYNKFVTFMGDDYMKGLQSEIPGIVNDYIRHKEVESGQVIQNAGFVSDTKAKGTSKPTTTAYVDITRPNINRTVYSKGTPVKYTTINDVPKITSSELNAQGTYDIIPDYKQYSTRVKNELEYIGGVSAPKATIHDWDLAISPGSSESKSKIAKDIDSANPQFIDFILKQDLNAFNPYQDFKRNVEKLKKQGINSFVVTEEESKSTLESVQDIVDLKQETLGYLNDMYNEYRINTGEHLTSYPIQSEYLVDGKKEDASAFIKESVLSNWDSRDHVIMVRNEDEDKLEVVASSASQKGKNPQTGEEMSIDELEAQFKFNLEKGTYGAPQYVTYDDIVRFFPEYVKNLSQEEQDNINKGLGGMYLYQGVPTDNKGVPEGKKQFIFVDAKDDLDNPGQTPVSARSLTVKDDKNEDMIYKDKPIIDLLSDMVVGEEIVVADSQNRPISVRKSNGASYQILMPGKSEYAVFPKTNAIQRLLSAM